MNRTMWRVAVLVLMAGVMGACASTNKAMSTKQGGESSMQSSPEAKQKAIEQIRAMMASGEHYTNDDILPYFDQLDPISIDEMLGTWKGGKFDGGKKDAINWYGKRFNSAEDAEPLLALNDKGEVYSFDKWGMARLRDVKFRGKVSVAMLYNQKPLMDYFRKIDDDTIIGLGEMKGQLLFFFHLTREK